ncbi:MAG: efflux RND transporter periplasmic adaptor subunit [Planctomycetota bacterium]|jgi:RND family efflux transporter MFP subunit
MKKALKLVGNVLLVIALLAVGVVGMGGMVITRPKPETKAPEVLPPYVETVVVSRGTLHLRVKTQGTVAPRTEGVLVSEVSGRVVEVAPDFASGGFFDRGGVLMKIDPRDFELARAKAKAAVAGCEARLTRVQAEAKVAKEEWDSLGDGEAPPLALRKPQLAQAEAELEAARAALEHAEVSLERTVIRAPYDGCVRAKIADVGQYVSPGAPIARIFAVDYAEVRLPLSDDQFARLDFGALRAGRAGVVEGIEVVLRARVGGEARTWMGEVVRLEGHVDMRSRMTYAVARIDDPYGRAGEAPKPPLAVGLFVEAEISGREVGDVSVVPRTALRNGAKVLVVDDENRLRYRPVDVVQARGGDAVVRGLETGESVCLTTLEVVTDGMKVRSDDESAVVEAPARNSEVK